MKTMSQCQKLTVFFMQNIISAQGEYVKLVKIVIFLTFTSENFSNPFGNNPK